MFEEFYQKYAQEEQEVIVLIRKCIGAGHHEGGFLDMIATTLGMVFCDTDEIRIHEGRLRWPVSEEESHGEKGWGRFREGQICRLKVRRLLDGYVPEHTTAEQFNSWAVTQVVETSVSCPWLEHVWNEYMKPVCIEDEVLGTLQLNRDSDCLEGEVSWRGEEVCLTLEVDPDDEETWDLVRDIARKFMADCENRDKAMREFAAGELTALANEWQAEDDDLKDADPVTEEVFARRIALSELSIGCEGDFTAYYNDDDMFWGHVVEVCGTLDQGAERANIAG